MSDPTEAEVRQAYETVSRMVHVEYQDLKARGFGVDSDWSGLVEGKRQIMRYAIRWFGDDAYDRFERSAPDTSGAAK